MSTKTYDVRTHGCQMNVHDSERLAGLLETAGYVDVDSLGADRPETADVVVFNTCAVRENADNKLYGNLGQLRAGQAAQPRHADRRRRVPGAEGPRHDRRASAVGRRRLRHAQHRLAARRCSSAPATTSAPRSRSARASRSSRPPSRPGGTSRTAAGCRSRSAATTPARSASSRACAARRPTADRATSSPRSGRSWSRAWSR